MVLPVTHDEAEAYEASSEASESDSNLCDLQVSQSRPSFFVVPKQALPSLAAISMLPLTAAGMMLQASSYGTLISYGTGCTLDYDPTLNAGAQTLLLVSLLAVSMKSLALDAQAEKGLLLFSVGAANSLLIKTICDMGTFDCLAETSETPETLFDEYPPMCTP